MENLVQTLTKALNKLSKTFEKVDRDMPGTKWCAIGVTFALVIAFITKPKDASVYNMPTRELVHKYYGNEYIVKKEEKDIENSNQSKRAQYPFGNIG